MMFNRQKAANAFSLFKLRWRGESTLAASLLEDVPPEIELSQYGRIPSPGSESPSDLLNGESLNVEPIADLDLFFERVYSYYCEKGLWCIIIKWILNLFTLGFTVCFSGFFLLYVDWNGLRNAKCGMDAVESGIRPCDLAKEALHEHPLTPLTVPKAIILIYLGLFSIYWIFCFLRFFAQLKDILGVRQFYYDSLHVSDAELRTMPWATVLEKVVHLPNNQQLCIVKYLSAHDVVMRLMRKENYLIGMLNKGVLAFPISAWVPGAGPVVKVSSTGEKHRLILTKTLEWTLNWCILQSMFDRNFCVKRDFISNPNALKKRLLLVGLVMLFLSPFLVIFMLVYLFLRHAEQFYHHPSTASSRRWSNLSRWIFREFNEVDHLFRHRINGSVMHASDYLKQFPSPIISIIAKFLSFVSGGFVAILIIIAVLEESLLEGHIFGRNLIWYAAVFSAITAISRSAIPEEILVTDPGAAMSMVVQHTHYMPKRWRGKENTEAVRLEFETLFQYTGMMLLEEMASIFLTPYLLIFVVPKRVDDILQFIADFTVHVEGVGHVCSFGAFDFQSHGNTNYGSPHNSSKAKRSSQGKMEKSFLSFQTSYPLWESDAKGKQFLSVLQTFRGQMLHGQDVGHLYSPSPLRRGNYNAGVYGNRNTLYREMTNFGVGHHLGSLWPFEDDQKNHPYILDWYYVTRPHNTNAIHYAEEVSKEAFELPEPQPGDFWMTSRVQQANEEHGDDGHGLRHYEGRLHSHLGASTSTSFFQESVFHHDPGDMVQPTSRSHWWARGDPYGTQAQTSFMDPPDFNHYNFNNRQDGYSDRISEEEDPHLDWRIPQRLDRSNMDDFEVGGDISLHFDDVYSRPPETPTANLGHSSFYDG